MPEASLKEYCGVIVSLRLYILGKCQGYRARICLGREDAHRFYQRRNCLLRSIEAVPIAGHRFETVVHRDVLRVSDFQLLQDGCYIAAGKYIAWQEQNGQSV